jgi:mannosyltransferase OCH1-like enzyme
MIPKFILPRNNLIISNYYELIKEDNQIFIIILYYINKNMLNYIIRRIDEENGWNNNLKLKIFDIELNNYELFIIESSMNNEKKGSFQTNQIELKELIYKNQNIPKNIIQTYYKDDYISKSHYNAIHSFIDLNPEYTYYYFNDNDCRNFIKNHFELKILLTYDKIIPKALKSDLFRLCFIYLNGGCYFDHKQILMIPIREWINPQDKQIYCDDEPHLWMHNGIFCSVANASEIYDCIQKIVYNVENELFLHWADLTGPRIFYDYTFNYNRPLKIIKGAQFKDQKIVRKSNNQLLLYRCYFNYYKKERKECYDTLYRQKKLFYKDLNLNDQYLIYRFPSSFPISIKTTNKKTKKSIQNFYNSFRSFDLYQDKFSFEIINSNELKIKRIDSQNGWNFNLIIYLLNNLTHQITEYIIGSHSYNSKIISIN